MGALKALFLKSFPGDCEIIDSGTSDLDSTWTTSWRQVTDWKLLVVVVQSLSRVWLFATPWTEACQSSLSFTISWSLHKLMSIELVMPSNHLILCHPFLLLPSNLSQHQSLFQWISFLHQMAKVLELQHQSFQRILTVDLPRVDWLDLLTVQGTLKSLLQHHGSKVSILWCSAFFMVRVSHRHMTTAGLVETGKLGSWWPCVPLSTGMPFGALRSPAYLVEAAERVRWQSHQKLKDWRVARRGTVAGLGAGCLEETNNNSWKIVTSVSNSYWCLTSVCQELF